MQPRNDHVASITGLRAIAVIAVVLFHVDAAWMSGGFVGVDCFFVISGFVVAHSVLTRDHANWRSFVLDFYSRRLSRLYPALLAYVAVATLGSLLFVPLVNATADLEQFGAAAVLGYGNFMLKDQAGSYFAAAGEFNPFTHTWSLAVEEQYYALFSIFAFPLLAGGSKRARTGVLIGVMAAAAASLAFCAAKSASDPTFAFYMMPTRFWELALGLLLRLALDRSTTLAWARRSPHLAEAIGWGGMAVLVWSCLATTDDGFPFPGALVPCLATCALIATVWLWRRCGIARLLAAPLPVWIGKASYSIYLWHWGVVVFMRWTVGIDTPMLKFAALAGTFALGAASYHWIEGMAQRPRTMRNPAPRTIVRFAAATALTACLCSWSVALKPQFSLSATRTFAIWNPYSGPSEDRPCKADLVARVVDNAAFIRFVAPCRRADARRLFVVGDSHAAAYRRMLWRVAETGAWDVRLYALNGCGFINFRWLNRDPACERFTAETLESVRQLAGPGDVLFLPSLQTERIRDNWGTTETSHYGQAIEPAIVAANGARLAQLARLGLPIVVEGPKPLSPVALFRCADWFNREQHYCTQGATIAKAEMQLRMRQPSAALHSIADRLPGVTVWELADVLCPGPRCNGYDGGLPLFFDVDHLSGHANDLLLAPFLRTLQTASGPAAERVAMQEKARPAGGSN